MTTLSVLAAVALWAIGSTFASPFFVPSPLAVGRAIVTLTSSGDLPTAVAYSYFRILVGWAVGCAVAIPLALVAGRIRVVKQAIEPFFNFFRFVPPIAFLGIAILWFGIGEQSKIAIIIYTSLFTVFMNTMAGAASVDESPSRAALCLGASRRQVLWRVVLPATVPAILVGMRVGMGFSFMSVVAAEMIAANEGVGFLIYNARLFLKTANAFAGILTLGLMGLAADLLFRVIAKKLFAKHALPF
ncbi:ABC transporter permease [Alsobacter sp. KACC 23698]|uniref:ABC transporter permease n=1 Tax=Alsobacter sp. KACC 23698 TaxID=3149229 RepID=A0AAU7JLK1_9HYPH